MKFIKSILLAACLTAAVAYAAFIDFNSLGPVGDPAPSISAGGVTVSFSNLEISEIGATINGFGGTEGSNQVVVADQVNFNGQFLTALDFGRAQCRSSGFVRTIEFDTAVTDVSMYIADIDACEGITASAFDESDTLLDTMAFPSSTGLDSKVLLVGFGTLSGIRKVTLVGDDPVGIDNLSFGPEITDTDGDGVLDDDDFCPATADTANREGVPTVQLRPNHWALIDGDSEFDTVINGKGKGPNRSYLIEDTAGCSCEQIIEMQGLGNGHTYHGCSISAMDDWVEFVNQ